MLSTSTSVPAKAIRLSQPMPHGMQNGVTAVVLFAGEQSGTQRAGRRFISYCFTTQKLHKNAVDGASEKTEDLADFFSGKLE